MNLRITAIMLFLFPALRAQESFPVNGTHNQSSIVYAFTNATLHVDAETVIPNGSLLIRDGRVLESGEKITIPKGAVVYDLKGKHIYPSFIDLFSNYGVPEIKRQQGVPGQGRRAPQYETNTKGAYGWNQAVKPETEAYRLFSADEKAAEELRKLGFGAVLTSQQDGIIRGTAAFVSLANGPEQSLILSDRAAALLSFDKGSSTQNYPGSLMGAIALIRQTYLDAQWYKQTKDKKEYNISLEAFNNLQNLPQIFEVNDKLSALRADKIGDEFKMQYIIRGGGNEYQRPEEIKKTNAKFILPLNFPAAFDVTDPYDAAMVSLAEMKHWELAPTNPSALEKKFIPFAFTLDGLKDKKDFWKNLRKAIQYGLSEKQALKALTVIPAEMMGQSGKIGTLRPGMIANFLITSSSLFDDKNILYQNWVQGKQYILSDYNTADIRGRWELKIGNDRSFTMTVTGEPDKPKVTLQKDTVKASATAAVNGRLVTIHFKTKEDKGSIRLSGNVDENPVKMWGKGQLVNGDWVDWTATYKSAYGEGKKDSAATKNPEIGEVIYPFVAYGKKKQDPSLKEQLKDRYDAVLFKNVTVWTNEAEGVLKNKDVYITEGRIVRIDDNIEPTKLAFAKVIDGKGKHLTPGIIDEHTHIAISSGVNEGTQAVSSEVSINDVVNSEDINIYRQLAGGVVAGQLLHGSANPVGGQSALIKLRWGKSPEEMKIARADGFIKFALGENVKQSNWGDVETGRFPQTRMGVEQVYFDVFTRAKEYNAKWKAYNSLSAADRLKTPMPRRDLELDAIAEILDNKRFITCHSYVQSEINMLMHVADSMKFRVNTFTHILEGYKVADKMKARNIGGSCFSDWWSYKMEVKEAIPYNGAIMHKAGVVTAFNSDDAEMARRLNQEAAKAVKYGNVSEEDALKFVTLNPAKLLHLDDRMGSIKVGKDADVVLWSDHPLSIYAKAEKTLVDGIIYYDIEEDKKLREEIKKERARLIQKMIEEKNSGEKTQRPEPRRQQLYECDTELERYLDVE